MKRAGFCSCSGNSFRVVQTLCRSAFLPVMAVMAVLPAAALVGLLAGCTGSMGPATGSGSRDFAPPPARITVLYDAFGRNPSLTKDWGYAALVEYGGKRILFDTGDNPEVLAHNAAIAGVDFARLDFVILSHRHGDHMGGLTAVLRVNPHVPIYAPKENFGIFGSDLPSKFYRKETRLPPEQRYYNGEPPEVMHFGTAFPGANITLVDKSTEVQPGIHLIAQVSDAPGTRELKELSLALSTPQGLVLVVGCAHPGIENIVAEAAKIDPHIHLIAGGLHLVVASDEVIAKVTSVLHDQYQVDFVAPGHCTGEPTFLALAQAFGERYVYAGLGARISLGEVPREEAGRGHPAGPPLDVADLRAYRKLQAHADADDAAVLAQGPRP